MSSFSLWFLPVTQLELSAIPCQAVSFSCTYKSEQKAQRQSIPVFHALKAPRGNGWRLNQVHSVLASSAAWPNGVIAPVITGSSWPSACKGCSMHKTTPLQYELWPRDVSLTPAWETGAPVDHKLCRSFWSPWLAPSLVNSPPAAVKRVGEQSHLCRQR